MSALPSFEGASLTERQGAAILRDPETAELLAYVVDIVETGVADDTALTTPQQVSDFFRSRR